MIYIIKWLWIFSFLIVIGMPTGCSGEERIRIGSPFYENGSEGVKFHSEVTDADSIANLKKIIEEARGYIWYEEDGSSILSDARGSRYFALTKKQTNELRSILQE